MHVLQRLYPRDTASPRLSNWIRLREATHSAQSQDGLWNFVRLILATKDPPSSFPVSCMVLSSATIWFSLLCILLVCIVHLQYTVEYSAWQWEPRSAVPGSGTVGPVLSESEVAHVPSVAGRANVCETDDTTADMAVAEGSVATLTPGRRSVVADVCAPGREFAFHD